MPKGLLASAQLENSAAPRRQHCFSKKTALACILAPVASRPGRIFVIFPSPSRYFFGPRFGDFCPPRGRGVFQAIFGPDRGEKQAPSEAPPRSKLVLWPRRRAIFWKSACDPSVPPGGGAPVLLGRPRGATFPPFCYFIERLFFNTLCGLFVTPPNAENSLVSGPL